MGVWILNYAGIKYFDIANAPGVSVSLFVSGCPHHCTGCFNEQAWAYDFGEPYTQKTTQTIVEFYKANPQVTSFGLLGGEPFAQSREGTEQLIDLVITLARETQCSSYWVWSGYTFEQIMAEPRKEEMLRYFDVLVDGRFELDKKDLRLAHRGSSNQRIVDIGRSIDANQVVLWSENNGL